MVEVEGGSYPEQTISSLPNRVAPFVIFQPSLRGRVQIASVRMHGSYVEFRDLAIAQWETSGTAHHVTFRNVVNQGFWINSSSNVSVIRGSVGPGVDFHPAVQTEYLSTVPPRNILIQRVFFHDWTRTSPDVHTECLQVSGGDGVTIRSNRFRNCHVMDILVSHWGSSPQTRNVTIENNVLDTTGDGGFYAINAGAFENLLIRNNSSTQGFHIDSENAPSVNVRVIGNVAPGSAWQCNSRVTYSHNVWSGAKCGRTDRNAPSGFLNPAGLDLRLKPRAAAIDRGDPKSFPRTDIDGKRRPSGRAPDAGAYELR